MKTIRHKWIKMDGFRIHKCERCNCIRKWSDGWQMLTYTDRFGRFYLRTPDCVMPNTLI